MVVVVCMVCFGSSFAALILDFGYAVDTLFVCVICGAGFLDGCVAGGWLLLPGLSIRFVVVLWTFGFGVSWCPCCCWFWAGSVCFGVCWLVVALLAGLELLVVGVCLLLLWVGLC